MHVNEKPYLVHVRTFSKHSIPLLNCEESARNSRVFSSTTAPSVTMASRIPTAASVSESAVIAAPLSHVWHLIKIQDFHVFWSALSKSESVKGASPETDIVKWTFTDGTVLDVKQEEHSVGRVRSARLMHPIRPKDGGARADRSRPLIILSRTQSSRRSRP